ncbi:MAG: hypothetical protein KatS3mg111_2777 [Pirellulaceae bacterium]|nr:MAG: hypothetical protein KatS3mg111_2777 [Pirellulaceae bacterium]
MKRRHIEDEAVGQDAFLDTTANLVGILIILVVVVGAKTKVAADKIGRQTAAEVQRAASETQTAAQAVAQALVEQREELKRYDFEVAYRRTERDALLARVVAMRSAVEDALAQADQDRREQIEQQRRLDELQKRLETVREQLGAAEKRPRPKIILEHLPTPMAQTVFTREFHVQLKNNRLTVIPWDRLVEMLKSQAPLAASRHRSRGDIDDTLGPVGGFLMHYRMVPIPGGFELDRFELEPLPDAPAETLEQALSPAGRLQVELATRNPAETVVTVWVYPDSFETYRQLKAKLFDQGFLSAARPLPEDVRIGASPHGTRSAAQ